MPEKVFNEACFLCGIDARWQWSDFENRRHYLCTNPACGEYEISRFAMDRIANNAEFKHRASAMASKITDSNEILEIVAMSPAKQIEAKVVKRRPRLGGD